jgi:hypothetical protein
MMLLAKSKELFMDGYDVTDDHNRLSVHISSHCEEKLGDERRCSGVVDDE